MLMDLAPYIFLLRMIDIGMPIGLERPIAAGRVRIQPTVRVDSEVRSLLHGLHDEIFGRLDDDLPLATDPGDDRRTVFVVVPPTGLAFLRQAQEKRRKNPVYDRALVAIQEHSREVIEGALAVLLLTAVALQSVLVVVGAPRTDVVAMTPRTWEGPIFPARHMDVRIDTFRGGRGGEDAKQSTWLSFSLDHGFG
jgi:hypothetical protein